MGSIPVPSQSEANVLSGSFDPERMIERITLSQSVIRQSSH